MIDNAYEAPSSAPLELDLARARRGDPKGFESIYRQHAGKVYGLCLRMTRDVGVAEDCTQETFISAWRALGSFHGHSALGTWLHRIAVNTVLARGRRGELDLTPMADAEDEIDAATMAVADELQLDDLEALLGRLPQGARNVAVLFGVYGYSHEETADMLGIAVGTCKAQLHRARHLLKQHLNAEDAA
jgi:RNA polymerase sigma-70 factor, ECF subfamily